jgi:glycolate oxidase
VSNLGDLDYAFGVLARDPFPRPSAAEVDRLRIALDRALGGSKVLTSNEACERFAADESDQEPVLPDAVVLAKTADDIAKTLAVASDLQMPVTPRAGGTGKSGGAVPVCGGVVLSVIGMTDIKEIDTREQLVVVEPGVILNDLHRAVEAEGMFYPPDPNSRESCALGGNVAENAGGPRAFKYGVTRDYVLALDALTAEGHRLQTGRRTIKGVTGYDTTALLVGSEGTLAVVVEATLRLRKKPPSVATLLEWFSDVGSCADHVGDIVAAGLVPRCMELMDSSCLEAMRTEGVAVPSDAGAMLLVELDGTEDECLRDMEQLGTMATEGQALDVVVAQSGTQRAKLWAVRSEMTNIVKKLARHKIAEDVVVPRSKMAELIDEAKLIGEARQLRIFAYGHAGDGNLHVNVLWNEDDQLGHVRRALEELFRVVVRLGGTLTGEHGVGTSKSKYLGYELSTEHIAMQRRIKELFDPKGILNPGKIFPRSGHGAC